MAKDNQQDQAAAAEAAAAKAAEEKAAAEAAAAAAAAPREVRVLVDHGELRCDTVAELDSATAAALKREGIVDDDPAAVAACIASKG